MRVEDRIWADGWGGPTQGRVRVYSLGPSIRALLADPPPRPAPPSPVACPSCGAEHDGRYEDRWEDDDERTHDIHRCPCGAVRLDGVWLRPVEGDGTVDEG